MDRHRNIKIVDFGMAALQPAGKWLNTSCGSPHYASPEIARGARYQGDLSDIWSCGVVLYVMITGMLPFGNGAEGESLRDVLREVLAGEIEFPEGVSAEAQHLICSMLQVDPRRRISIEMMWTHPLLRKYEHLARNGADVARWIGGPVFPLTTEDCGKPLKKRSEIDGEILRNLCTLWHEVNQETVIERLLCEE